jgi:glutaredoxin-like protein
LSMISDDQKELMKLDFQEKLVNPVKITLFTKPDDVCPYCSKTKTLLQEIASANEKISVEVYDFDSNQDKAKALGIDKTPGIAIVGAKDYNVRIYGAPYGYELKTLIEAVINVSKGQTDLTQKTKDILVDVKRPVHIQVFVSLTCPHCPEAAAIAHKLAIENPFIKADVIDSSEFADLALKYNVTGVPKIVINEKIEFMGAFNEDLFAEHVLLGAMQ